MKKTFEKYLKSIGITSKAMIERVEQIHDECLLVCTLEPEEIFVDEYIDAEGRKQYECVNFFSTYYHFGSSSLTGKKFEYFYLPLKKKVLRWKIEKTDYNFKKATDKSRIVINFDCSGMTTSTLKASGKNCEVVLSILKKYVIPNLG